MNQAIVDRLNWLEESNGYLTPELVVNDAMSPDSPLHGEFTWNKDHAAWKQWLHEARQLIKSVKVIIQTETKTIKAVAYVRDPSKTPKEQGYLAVNKVKDDKELSREVLVDEFKRINAALLRAQRLAIVFNLESDIDKMTNQVTKLRQEVEEHVF